MKPMAYGVTNLNKSGPFQLYGGNAFISIYLCSSLEPFTSYICASPEIHPEELDTRSMLHPSLGESETSNKD